MWRENVKTIRNELIESFHHAGEDKLNEKPASGGWSIAQVVLHLAGAETRFMELALRSATETMEKGEKVDLTVFDDPAHKMIAPIDPPDEHRAFDELIEALRASRQLTERLESSYTSEELEQKTMDHHRFGTMPIEQVFELLGRHEKRHIRQIHRIKEQITRP
ncbi:PadR family transcriptional regulator [Rossellomorea marisflavi]|uniref:DinB family protein n=1 Tax=Rossellomorea marisflavi TaxID=189381 RepID=UPI0025CAE6E3|nr:DinB family protein [Rossellomorea marisflavi]GLI85027.1 PadR family transcriptional regulator [Rossellomorea marisflavi]